MRDWSLDEGRWIDSWGTDQKWKEWEELKEIKEWRVEDWQNDKETCPREEYLIRREEEVQLQICQVEEERHRVMKWKYQEGDEVLWRDVGKDGWTLDDLADYLQWREWEEEDALEQEKEEEKRQRHKALLVMEWAGEQQMEKIF
ncbi:hypothetical protein CTheo_8675 [Ceratobasidium theobromae]|uniref:Uncharacterized protein n=1 Tax=Ceratobasidium theobromae TaxID=1582974 RepID=A0A5N5Q802_9AGAM|nr:hypothetical protein CTheo_8675 [Ceratobasidium theobromae]